MLHVNIIIYICKSHVNTVMLHVDMQMCTTIKNPKFVFRYSAFLIARRPSVCLLVRPSVYKPFHHALIRNMKLFSSRTVGQISTKLCTKHPWVKRIQVYSNEVPRLFQRGDNNEITKIHWLNLKIFIRRTTEPLSTKLGKMHPLTERGSNVFNWSNTPFSKGR